MAGSFTISPQFSGPPGVANGGYVAGTMAEKLGPGFSYRFRIPVPLDTPLRIDTVNGMPALLHGDAVCVEARPAASLPSVPPLPGLREAREAHPLAKPFWHNCCVCCSSALPPEAVLGVSVGQLAGCRPGMVAGAWISPPAFAGPDGSIAEALVWSALDCPGYFAWVAAEGSHVALTSAMSGGVFRRPIVNEEYVIFAWSGERISRRRRTAGVALMSADGEVMAQVAQEWIRMGQSSPEE